MFFRVSHLNLTEFTLITFLSLIFFITGIVLFDLEEQKIERIYEAIMDDAIANGQMNKDVKDEILRLLISSHKYE
jgi:hypothetical protein